MSDEYDVVVVGSGGGAMTGAFLAQRAGLATVVVEKTALLGGTSNMMLAELVAQFVQSLVNWGMGGAAALVLLVVTLALYAVQLRYFNPARGK